MSSPRLFILLFLSSTALAAGDGFMIGAGVESDSGDSLSAALIGGAGLTENTWLSAGVAKTSIDLGLGLDLESKFADIELDHYFDPVGVRIGASYWGDSDLLESHDWRASLYWRNDKAMLAVEYEFRDFDFIIPSTDRLTSREVMFDADGLGLSARFQVSDSTSLRIRGIKYDYSVPFRPIEYTDAASLLTVSRLSLINTLVDYRAAMTIGLDRGSKHWELDFSTWQGAINESRTNSITLRYLMPMSEKTDIEFGLGYDDSELYGDVTFFSLYLYFYGAN
jgi:hypothetical protein